MTNNPSGFWKRWFKKKRMVIKAWHGNTLLLMSYENPAVLNKSPIQGIVGIDRIEVVWEDSNV